MYGTDGTFDSHYFGEVAIRGKLPYRGGEDPEPLHGRRRREHRRLPRRRSSARDFTNPTVAPSVRSNLTTILGRTAAYRGAKVTWDEMMAGAETLEADLVGPAELSGGSAQRAFRAGRRSAGRHGLRARRGGPRGRAVVTGAGAGPGQPCGRELGRDEARARARRDVHDGQPAGAPLRQEEETTRQVTLTKPFRIAATEVTQKQWAAVMGPRPRRPGGRAAGHLRLVERRAGVLPEALAEGGRHVPPADRGGVGVRVPRRRDRRAPAIATRPRGTPATATARRTPSRRSRRTPGACSTCSATSPSGRRTPTRRTRAASETDPAGPPAGGREGRARRLLPLVPAGAALRGARWHTRVVPVGARRLPRGAGGAMRIMLQLHNAAAA